MNYVCVIYTVHLVHLHYAKKIVLVGVVMSWFFDFEKKKKMVGWSQPGE